MQSGRTVLARDDVMDGVPEMLERGAGGGDLPRRDQARDRAPADPVSPRRGIRSRPSRAPARSPSTPGAPRIELDGRQHRRPARCRSARTSTSPRPTRRCAFDRAAAHGYRLDIAAGTAVRFEPGIPATVDAGAAGRRRASSRADGRGRAGLDGRARPRAVRRSSTARPPATGSGSPTPTCCIEVERGPLRRSGRAGDEAVFGGGKVDPRVDGPGPRDPRRGGARPRHHRRGRARPLGHRQGRRRHPRRPDRRARQGRQPRHHGRRPPGSGDRPGHRDARRQRAGSSPPAASTATSTSSARRSSTRRSARASRR